jgi:hypothetical protein
MPVRIDIDNKWVVTSDQYQFILQEKKAAISGKNADKEWMDTIGYYPKVSQLVAGLIHHHILNSSAQSFDLLAAEVARIGQACELAFIANA